MVAIVAGLFRVMLCGLRNTESKLANIKCLLTAIARYNDNIITSWPFVACKYLLAIITLSSSPDLRLLFVGARINHVRFLVETIYAYHVYILTYSYKKS